MVYICICTFCMCGFSLSGVNTCIYLHMSVFQFFFPHKFVWVCIASSFCYLSVVLVYDD